MSNVATQPKPQTEEELHQQLLKERDEFAQKAMTPEQREEAARLYTVPERLSRRGREDPMTIILGDKLGELMINVKTPSMHVILEVQAIQKLMRTGMKAATVDDIEKLEDRLAHLLGDEICADPELGYDYWKNGDYDASLPWEIIGKVMTRYNQDMNAGANFRERAERKDARPAVSKDGAKAE